MTQKEFTDRTGLTPSEAEFSIIHSIYVDSSLDKDEFCAEFKKHCVSLLADDVTNKIIEQQERIKELSDEVEQYRKREIELAEFLIIKAITDIDGNLDCNTKAVELIGHLAVIEIKLKRGYELWEGDRRFLLDTLKSQPEKSDHRRKRE